MSKAISKGLLCLRSCVHHVFSGGFDVTATDYRKESVAQRLFSAVLNVGLEQAVERMRSWTLELGNASALVALGHFDAVLLHNLLPLATPDVCAHLAKLFGRILKPDPVLFLDGSSLRCLDARRLPGTVHDAGSRTCSETHRWARQGG